MKKFRRKKLAFALACASIFGCKTQAAQNIKTEQSLAAVGATTKNSNTGFINWVKNHKLGFSVGALTAVTAVTLTILGVKHWGKKESGGDPNIGGDPNKGNNPIDNKAITKKDIDDPKKMVKEHNDKIIEDAINKGLKVELDDEGEERLRNNIKRFEKLVLNDKNWFSKNFVEYSQNRLPIQGGKLQIDTAFSYAGCKVSKDWAEVNKLFSFNDKIYNALNDVFSDNIKLSEFFVKNACSFSFGFSDCSIHVSFDEKKNNLEIRYTVITKEKVESRTFKFKMPKDN